MTDAAATELLLSCREGPPGGMALAADAWLARATSASVSEIVMDGRGDPTRLTGTVGRRTMTAGARHPTELVRLLPEARWKARRLPSALQR